MKLKLLVLALFMGTAAWAGPQLQPSEAKAHLDRGNAHYNKRDLNAAITEFREAIRLNPNGAAAHCGLADALREKKTSMARYRKLARQSV